MILTIDGVQVCDLFSFPSEDSSFPMTWGPSILHLFLPLCWVLCFIDGSFSLLWESLRFKECWNQIWSKTWSLSNLKIVCSVRFLSCENIYTHLWLYLSLKKKKTCFWCVFPIHVDNRGITYRRVPRWLICHLISEDQMSNWRVVNS
jgi:hypothetical protein